MQKIRIVLSREHKDFENDVKKCFEGLDFDISSDYARLSESELPMQIMILVRDGLIKGATGVIIKKGIERLYKKFKESRVVIQDKNAIMFAIDNKMEVNVVVLPENRKKFEKIKNLDDLLNHLKEKG